MQESKAVLSYTTRLSPKDETVTTETSEAVRAACRARRWALIVPREHGAWGLLLVPLFTGVAAGMASTSRLWPLLAFTIAALSLFWLRTPIESLTGTSPLTAHTSQEWWTAFLASILLAGISVACLTGLMWKGRNLELLFFGTVAGVAFVAQAVLRRLGRRARMAAQLVGIIGLTCTAPAAYYIGTGQLCIHSSRAVRFSERFARGRVFFLAQPALLAVLVVASLLRAVSPFMIFAFVPALVRGTRWFFRQSEPLNVKSLGWSEMKGAMFGILMAIAFIWS
jgi:hypothetical protein